MLNAKLLPLKFNNRELKANNTGNVTSGKPLNNYRHHNNGHKTKHNARKTKHNLFSFSAKREKCTFQPLRERGFIMLTCIAEIVHNI